MDRPGHAIRLRNAWEWLAPEAPDLPPRRLDLPTHWPADAGPSARLARRFNRPPIGPEERVFLRLDRVDGLIAATLNDEPVSPGLDVTGLLRPSNRLILEVDLAVCRDDRPWGEVALVISPAVRIGDGGAEPL